MDGEEQSKEQPEQPVDVHTDAFLGTLADFANTGFGIGITVHCQGMLISGTLISNVRFFEATRDNWKSSEWRGADEETAEAARTMLSDHAEHMIKILKERNSAYLAGGADGRALYLHLQDARFLIPGAPSFKAATWRCRIDQVAGFTIGQMIDG